MGRFDILADKIYPQVRGNGAVSLRQNQYRYTRAEEEDSAAASTRVHVEAYNIDALINLLPFLDFSKGLKINVREIGIYMVVIALIINLHTCLYGSQVCTNFNRL